MLAAALVAAPGSGGRDTPAKGQTFEAIADASVTAARPRANLGRSKELLLDRAPDARAYLTFRVRRLTTGLGAVLHVYALTTSRRGFSVGVSVGRWNERTVTYSAAPRVLPTRIDSGPVRAGDWVSTDVTRLVQGKQIVTLALTRSGTGRIRIASRESAHPPVLGVYPASYLDGPAGLDIILPSRLPGSLLGISPGGPGKSWEEAKAQFLSREQVAGRKLDVMGIYHGAPDGGCFYPGAVPFGTQEAWAARHGAIPYVSWSPGYSLDELRSGRADACLRAVARRARAFGRPAFIRMYWEFNVPSPDRPFSENPSEFVAVWRHTVDLFVAEGARNLSWVWCPGQSFYGKSSYDSFPGGQYVDWVCADGFNWNEPGAFCGALGNPHPGWCGFEEIFHGGPAAHRSVDIDFLGRKPFMIGEVGTVEGAPGQKRSWELDALARIKAAFPSLMAYIYFDQDTSSVESCSCNWRLDSSPSALDGFRQIAQDPYFRTRS